MTYKGGIVTGVITTLALVGASGAAYWLWKKPMSSAVKVAAPIPVTIDKPLKEDQINLITLKPEALQRLALEAGLVERKSVKRSRLYGGEVTVLPGNVIVVSAPVSGILRTEGGMPVAGAQVKRGQTLFQLAPLVSPESRTSLTTSLAQSKVDAEGQLKAAQTQLQAAQVALDRAKKLLAGEAGSRKAVDEAQAQVDTANAAIAAASSRREQLEKIATQVERGIADPIDIQSPADGMLRNISASSNQNVPSGATLFEIADLSRLWVRVPVYVGDLSDIETSAAATVGELTAPLGTTAGTQSAKPAAAPPSANAAAGSVDLYYEIDNRAAAYRPGQKVGITLELKGTAEGLVLPWSAVIHDIYGGTWVYEQTGNFTFVRRRIAVRFVSQGLAVLAFGPSEGTKVVTAGAAELFGAETGFSK